MNPLAPIVEFLRPANYVLKAIAASAASLAALLAYILARRARHRRYFRRRDARVQALQRQITEIVSGQLLPEQWQRDPLDVPILEEILLDRLEVAPEGEALQIRQCLRISGLLDRRIYQVRRRRGWRRLHTLVVLGRMRCPEAVPALAEGLDDPNPRVRIAAARGLGRCALPEAAEPILERLLQGILHLPVPVVQNALYHCCAQRPSLLLRSMHFASDDLRPVLARVLAEVASAEIGEDLVQMASDPLPEVRASAARALAGARPRLALAGLQQLAADAEWSVRLRAVVALGMLQDPRAIPALLETLCDRNRFVRLRSAGALSRLEGYEEEILERTVRTEDRYALQALVSEMQRTGALLAVLEGLVDPARRENSRRILLATVRAGAHRMLLDAVVHHPRWRVRTEVARLLAESRDTTLLKLLPFYEAASRPRCERIVLQWLEHRLLEAAGQSPPGAPQSPSSAAVPYAPDGEARPTGVPQAALARENR